MNIKMRIDIFILFLFLLRKIMKKDFIEGAKAAIPIILGYIPVGIAYGMMAKATGLTFFKALSFSLFVYTGAGQMAAVTMLSQNAAYVTIVFTGFFGEIV